MATLLDGPGAPNREVRTSPADVAPSGAADESAFLSQATGTLISDA